MDCMLTAEGQEPDQGENESGLRHYGRCPDECSGSLPANCGAKQLSVSGDIKNEARCAKRPSYTTAAAGNAPRRSAASLPPHHRSSPPLAGRALKYAGEKVVKLCGSTHIGPTTMVEVCSRAPRQRRDRPKPAHSLPLVAPAPGCSIVYNRLRSLTSVAMRQLDTMTLFRAASMPSGSRNVPGASYYERRRRVSGSGGTLGGARPQLGGGLLGLWILPCLLLDPKVAVSTTLCGCVCGDTAAAMPSFVQH